MQKKNDIPSKIIKSKIYGVLPQLSLSISLSPVMLIHFQHHHFVSTSSNAAFRSDTKRNILFTSVLANHLSVN